MYGVVRLVYDYGYRNPGYPKLGYNDSTDLDYVCGYCRNDSKGYYISTTTAATEPPDDDTSDDPVEWATTARVYSENETSVICEISQQVDDILFSRYVLIPAAVILFLLSLLLKRRRLAPECCSGRPGLVFPVNMIDHQKNRFAYVAAFVLSGWHMLDAIFSGLPFYEDELPDRSTFPNPPWLVMPSTKAFFLAVSCIQYAFVYYPVFAALSSHHILGYVLGTLYTWMLACNICLDDSLCPKGKRRSTVVLNYFEVAPPLICVVYLSIAFPVRVVKEICLRQRRVKTHPYPETISLAEARYVQDLLHRYKQPPPPAKLPLMQRIKNKIYVPTPGFKYSVSVLTGAALGLAFAYMTFIGFLHIFYVLWDFVQKGLKPLVSAARHGSRDPKSFALGLWLDSMDANRTCISWIKRTIYWLDTLEGCYYSALVLAFINIVICILLAVKNYKANMLMIYQGRHHDIPPASDYQPKALLLAAAKYVGFQAAYATWGFVLQFLLLFIIFSLVSAFFNLLCPYKSREIIIKVLQYFWVTIAVLVVVFVAQYIMGRYLFMLKNDKGEKVLALDNRRLFFNFNYFTIFSNTALGMVSCLVRILKSVVLGLYVLPRLDMSTLNRHYEWFDASFMSFVGLLYLENAHRNPVMLVAVGFMVEGNMQRRSDTGATFTVTNGEKTLHLSRRETARYKLARNRWLLAWTLFNNPGLRLYRKKPKSAPALLEDVPPQQIYEYEYIEYMNVKYSHEKDGTRSTPPPIVW